MDQTSRLKLYKKARRLRRRGLSYTEIRKEVNVAKSTLSLWLKDIPLKPEYRERLYTKKIQNLSRGVYSQRERRAREVNIIIEKSMNEIPSPISLDTYKLFGAALYWAEGNKTQKFGLTNSDPYLIRFFVDWLKTFFNIEASSLKPYLNIYSQQDELALKRFWSDITGIPLENFGKTFVKPSNKGYKKNTLYYGTIHIYVPKSIDLMHVVYGWRKAILQKFENDINFTERKWVSLKETPRPVNIREDTDAPIT